MRQSICKQKLTRKRYADRCDKVERRILELLDEQPLSLIDIANYLGIPAELTRKSLESLAQRGLVVNTDRGLVQRMFERIGLTQISPVPVDGENILLTSTAKAHFSLHPVISMR